MNMRITLPKITQLSPRVRFIAAGAVMHGVR